MAEIKKIVLVIGGAGFVGSHLCERLLLSGKYRVISLDNYFTGSIDNHVNGVEYIRGNSSDIDRLITCKPEIIFHLGEYSRVEKSFEDFHKVWLFNVIGTYKVLEFVRKINCKLVYAGSSTKFETKKNNAHTSPYAWSKASNTQLVINYGLWFDINYAITYFYNVYGPREIEVGEYATVIGIFRRQMRENENLTLVSPGTQKRHFTHVDDIIDGLVLVADKGHGDEYGIGCDESFSVLEVAEIFGGNIKYLPERRGNRMDSLLVNKKIKKLNWSAKKRLIDYIDICRVNGWE